MKINLKRNIILIWVLTLGSLQFALCSNSMPKMLLQETLADSTKLKAIQIQNPTANIASPNLEKRQLSIFEKLSLEDTDVLEMKITTDLQNLIVYKNKVEYQEAFLQYENENGATVKYELKVKPRGKYRRRVCAFPPLKLNFDKDDLQAEGLFADFDKLKLVTHCIDSKSESKENVLREYLAYKMYNVLTDNSFRVVLTKVTYEDIHNSMKPITRYGFIIENTRELANRMNGQDCDCHAMAEDMIATAPANIAAMFQYMIGNEDWSYTMMRNVKAIKSAGNTEYINVPYDFDFSGVVNANYAIPDRDLKHTDVKQRHFFGKFEEEQDYQKTVQHFIKHKDALLKTVRNEKRLSIDGRIEVVDYIKEFYRILENKDSAQTIFLSVKEIEDNKALLSK